MRARRKEAAPARFLHQPGVMGGLSEYRRMRDFSRTGEPEGDPDKKVRRRSLRFVIQKHAASHLHFDLRLELDGVMKSWAVPKGPSLDPATKRLAMQVEDHPVEYNTFEGTIPRGQYGGGTVMLWDRGTYTPDEARSGETPDAAVRRGLEAGKLSFTFHGERLHGSFALVRTRGRRGGRSGSRGGRSDKPQWLLIKHRDDSARPGSDITEEIATSVESGRTMDEIADDADRVWQSNRGSAKPATPRKGRQPAGTPADADAMLPMKPTPARTLPADGEWTWEPWRGGTRVMAFATPDAARLLDERGRDITRRNRPIAEELASLAGRLGTPFVAEGELFEEDGAATLAFTDLLLHGNSVLAAEPWRVRRDALRGMLQRRRLDRLERPDIASSAEGALRSAGARGWPGVLGRREDAPYTPGEKSEALLRITR